MKRLPQPLLDRYFKVAVAIKGLDGVIEALSGLTLLFIPLAKIKGEVANLALYEIQEDKHAFIAHLILTLDQHVHTDVQLFATLYLLGHGFLKILLAFALLKGLYRWYPYAIAFLLAFIFYQAYLIGYNHSIGLALLTLFDMTVAWLTYLEWQRHRHSGGASQA